jgi:hypothetical protein
VAKTIADQLVTESVRKAEHLSDTVRRTVFGQDDVAIIAYRLLPSSDLIIWAVPANRLHKQQLIDQAAAANIGLARDDDAYVSCGLTAICRKDTLAEFITQSTTDTLKERVVSFNNILRRLAVNPLLTSLLTTDTIMLLKRAATQDTWHPIWGYRVSPFDRKTNKMRLDVACHTKADRVLAKTIMEAFGKLVEGSTFTVAKAEEIPKSN